MKSPSVQSLVPLTAIALGATALAAQPGQAAEYGYDVDYYDNYETWNYGRTRLRVPSLDHAYRRGAPSYHYAYYAIARPEYLL